jgi:hypothetical protein
MIYSVFDNAIRIVLAPVAPKKKKSGKKSTISKLLGNLSFSTKSGMKKSFGKGENR